jgi:hypothetical protein
VSHWVQHVMHSKLVSDKNVGRTVMVQKLTQNKDNCEQVTPGRWTQVFQSPITPKKPDRTTHANHTRAALPSVFLVNSQESSMPTGSIGNEQTPMMMEITNIATTSFGRTTQCISIQGRQIVFRRHYLPRSKTTILMR